MAERQAVLGFFHVADCPRLHAGKPPPLVSSLIATALHPPPGRSSLTSVLLKFHANNARLLRDGAAYDEAAYDMAKRSLHALRHEPTVWNWLTFWYCCREQREWKVQVSDSEQDTRMVSRISARGAIVVTQLHRTRLRRIIAGRLGKMEELTELEREEKQPPRPRLSLPTCVPPPSLRGYRGWDEQTSMDTEEVLKLEGRVRDSRVDGHLTLDFFEQGPSWARSVVRLSGVPMGEASRDTQLGTAFLVSDSLLMTCAHVLPSHLIAEHPSLDVEFDVFGNTPPEQRQRGRLRPDLCFWARVSADRQVDVAIVAFQYLRPDGSPLPVGEASSPPRPCISLRPCFDGARDQDNQLVMLANPDGRPRASLGRTTRAIVDFAYRAAIPYDNDTSEGSSGGPVFNMDWQLVAVHHGQLQRCRINRGTTPTAIVQLLEDERQMAAEDILTSADATEQWRLLDQLCASDRAS